MRLVTLKSDTLKNYRQDKEMLQKAKRPCVLVISLKYKGIRHSFAVPLRSNINPSTPKEQYFPLPPRSVTKTKHRHGIHYIKMFPVKKTDCIYFRTMEYLMTGEVDKGVAKRDTLLTDQELELLKIFRYLNDKDALLKYARFLKDGEKASEKNSLSAG